MEYPSLRRPLGYYLTKLTLSLRPLGGHRVGHHRHAHHHRGGGALMDKSAGQSTGARGLEGDVAPSVLNQGTSITLSDRVSARDTVVLRSTGREGVATHLATYLASLDNPGPFAYVVWKDGATWERCWVLVDHLDVVVPA